jgi:integrase
MIVTFTQASIAKAAPPVDGKPYEIHYDSEVRGLGLRVTKNDARSWIFNYRVHGIERRLTIGAVNHWPLKLARDEARRLRRLVDQGRDPMAERHAERAAPTMRDLVERWRAERAPKMRPRSRAEYESLIRRIEPDLGNRKVADVTHQDVDRLHRKITAAGKMVRANRTAAFLSRLFNLAIFWKMRADNPVKGLERNPEQPRHRYLTDAELDRLYAALAAEPDQQSVNIVRLLLLTGARFGEVAAMRWAHLDLGEQPVWTKPAPAVKQAKLHRVPLSREVRDMLLAIKARPERNISPYVFPVRNRWGHPRDVKRSWARIRKSADLGDLRIHDLRHSFASLLVSAGYGLPMIGALLGHSQPQTTARYAHLIDTAQRQATEHLDALVKGKVVNFPKGKSA